MNHNTRLNKWEKGISYEVAFWNNVYRWNHTFKGLMGWSHYGKEILLEDFDANSFLKEREHPTVLDVGCGMSYATCNHICDAGVLTPIDIHYIDPLADYFNQILKRHHRSLPAIEFGMVEYLSSIYTDHNADLIVIQNALDHSANPIKGIAEAINVLKDDGILYLNHHPNEAEKEHYKGFHQYNITQEAGHLIIWNKNERWDINELLSEFASVKVSTHQNGHIIAIISRTGALTSALSDYQQDIRDLVESMMYMSKEHRSIGRTLHFKFQYWIFNLIQFIAQGLPWKFKMFVKSIIKQA